MGGSVRQHHTPPARPRAVAGGTKQADDIPLRTTRASVQRSQRHQPPPHGTTGSGPRVAQQPPSPRPPPAGLSLQKGPALGRLPAFTPGGGEASLLALYSSLSLSLWRSSPPLPPPPPCLVLSGTYSSSSRPNFSLMLACKSSVLTQRHYSSASWPPKTADDGDHAAIVMQVKWKVLLLLLATLASNAMGVKLNWCMGAPPADDAYCLGWRVGVEANNVQAWRTVPAQCLKHVERYMLKGQYSREVNMVVNQIYVYMKGLAPADDGRDAWILDVDDTCISNLRYYQGKRFGGDPFDSVAFRAWAQRGLCPAIPAVLRLFHDLLAGGFKVFLLTGRDEEAMGIPTTQNLHDQGFTGYEGLIMRGPAYRGKSAILFKSEIRKQLVKGGYRIWGNVGDQWSDLLGDCVGDRTFKIPNPMYFIP